MSEEQKDGGPAFPMNSVDGYYQYGMSLRAYIATAALQGLITCPETAFSLHEQYASASVKFADALIAELSK